MACSPGGKSEAKAGGAVGPGAGGAVGPGAPLGRSSAIPACRALGGLRGLMSRRALTRQRADPVGAIIRRDGGFSEVQASRLRTPNRPPRPSQPQSRPEGALGAAGRSRGRGIGAPYPRFYWLVSVSVTEMACLRNRSRLPHPVLEVSQGSWSPPSVRRNPVLNREVEASF